MSDPTNIDDWHKPGMWAVFDQDGKPVPESFDTTGYSARAKVLQALNKRWSVLSAMGFYVQELTPVGKSLR